MNNRLYTLDIASLPRFAIGFENIFEDLQRISGTLSNQNYPPYNILRIDDNNFRIEMAVAGFLENELSVELNNNDLIISGETTRDNDGEYVYHGISMRGFRKVFVLTQNTEIAGAHVSNGILSINLEAKIPNKPESQKIPLTFR